MLALFTRMGMDYSQYMSVGRVVAVVALLLTVVFGLLFAPDTPEARALCSNVDGRVIQVGPYVIIPNSYVLGTGFLAGDVLTLTAELIQGTNVTFSLTVNSTLVDTRSVPGTITYTFPADNLYTLYFGIDGNNNPAYRLTIACGNPPPPPPPPVTTTQEVVIPRDPNLLCTDVVNLSIFRVRLDGADYHAYHAYLLDGGEGWYFDQYQVDDLAEFRAVHEAAEHMAPFATSTSDDGQTVMHLFYLPGRGEWLFQLFRPDRPVEDQPYYIRCVLP